MNQISLGFRDYAAHLFPGSLYIIATVLWFCDSIAISKDYITGVIFAFLVGGYIVGFVMDAILAKTWLPIFRKMPFFKDPVVGYFDKVNLEQPKTFNDLAAKALCKKLGYDFFAAQKKATVLMYYMMREIDFQSDRLSESNTRINSLGNMAISFVPPVLLIAGVLAFKGYLFAVPVGVLIALALIRKNGHYRSWLARSVVREYVALNYNADQIAKAEEGSKAPETTT